MIQQVDENPVMPKFWGKNQSGMQAQSEMSKGDVESAKMEWLIGRNSAVKTARYLMGTGAHKQIANRVLEPWMFITVILTATEFDNWYKLRDSEFAQPEIAWVAREMRKAHEASTPEELPERVWHLPYVELDDATSTLYVDHSDLERVRDLIKIATARCARVSYLTHDGERSYEKDIKLHDRCRDLGHWSAFEHCAQPIEPNRQSGNFRGWKQYRKSFEGESGVIQA